VIKFGNPGSHRDVRFGRMELMSRAMTFSLPLADVLVRPQGLCESSEIGHGTVTNQVMRRMPGDLRCRCGRVTERQARGLHQQAA
jgi:hypothetical protein